jgi:hypothetical protein
MFDKFSCHAKPAVMPPARFSTSVASVLDSEKFGADGNRDDFVGRLGVIIAYRVRPNLDRTVKKVSNNALFPLISYRHRS